MAGESFYRSFRKAHLDDLGPVLRHAETLCLVCGHKLDAVARPDIKGNPGSGSDEMPRPGDVTMCMNCGSLMVFTDDGLRYPSVEEEASILKEPHIVEIRRRLQAIHLRSQRD